jgi:hypothetical protein
MKKYYKLDEDTKRASNMKKRELRKRLIYLRVYIFTYRHFLDWDDRYHISYPNDIPMTIRDMVKNNFISEEQTKLLDVKSIFETVFLVLENEMIVIQNQLRKNCMCNRLNKLYSEMTLEFGSEKTSNFFKLVLNGTKINAF